MAQTPKRKHRRRSGAEKLILALCLLVFALVTLYGVFRTIVRPPDVPADDPEHDADEVQTPEDPDSPEDTTPAAPARQRKEDYFTILVSGLDDDNGGSDTNILLSIDGKNGEINAVSLPRDTLIDTDWSVKKLNSAYNVGGIPRLRTEVSRLLGIPVDYYVAVDLKGFVSLVDAIEGVDFDVPIDMDYDDPVQDLHIHFKKGMQHLTGAEAIKVVRFRHNNDGSGYGTEDIGRIGTQQAFLTAVAKKMLTSINLSTLRSYAEIFTTYVDTDLTTGNLVWIGEQAMKMGMDNIHFHTLPGDGSGYYKKVSYYILYPDEVLTMINESFNPYDQPLTSEDMDILTGK